MPPPRWCTKGVLRKKIPGLREALRGRFREHHVVGMALDYAEYLEAAIAKLDGQVDALFSDSTSEKGVPFTDDCDYDDLGGDYFIRRASPDRQRDRLVEQLQQLGYHVALRQAAA